MDINGSVPHFSADPTMTKEKVWNQTEEQQILKVEKLMENAFKDLTPLLEKDTGIILFELNDDSTITLNNETIQIINDQFVYKNESWVVYETTQSLRTHHSLCSYEDTLFTVKGIMKLSKIEKFIYDFVNVNQNMVTFNTFPPTMGIAESFKAFQRGMHSYFDEDGESFKKIVEIFLELITPEELVQSFMSGSRNVLNCNVDNLNIGQVLSHINAYMSHFITYKQCLISSHPLSIQPFIIFGLFHWLLANLTYLPSSVYNTNSDRSCHYFGALLIDLFTDRCGLELYINMRNEQAKNMLNYYRARYPTILNITSGIAGLPNSFFEEIQQEIVTLFPFICFYHLKDKPRVCNTWETWKSSSGIKTNKPIDQYYKSLENLSHNMTNGMYDAKMVTEVMMDFQDLLQNTQNIKNSTTN